MRTATSKGGGAYLYANQQGCDGGRLYYDGCALVMVNGETVAQASQFSVRDVEVVTACVDLDDVRSYRAAIASRGQQARTQSPLPRVRVDFDMSQSPLKVVPSKPLSVFYHSPEEEIALGPACWLWDFLRRSGASGFFLPLSGGADSASSCTMVFVMCSLVYNAIAAGDASTLADLRKVVRDPSFSPSSPQQIAHLVLHTCYMGTSNSGAATQRRANSVAEQVGCYHVYANIDLMVSAIVTVFVAIFGEGKRPKFESQGGTRAEDLALQNIQARMRMVLAYLLAQLLPWVRGRSGFLLVLGSANVDEALRGYMTKYDCSSADINPIGGIAKADINAFLLHAAAKYNLPTLKEIVLAPPTAELRPIVRVPKSLPAAEARTASTDAASGINARVDENGATADGEDEVAEHSQLDEADMGMSYAELGWFGRLRKIERCGPLSMYRKLLVAWPHLEPAVVAEKVKRFFFYYALNRHKMTTLTPAYHAENYSPEDNRYDLRQFLYRTDWSRSFAAIDADVKQRSAATSDSR
jgi:NAD+ synthase (glutamine-hydrolysing)